MIQYVLVFLLGILCSAFMVLLAAPLFWRRAHYLWQKQMAAQLPLSLSAIEADRDLLRASHAVAIRKAEMQTALIRDKHTQALLKISTAHDELTALQASKQTALELNEELQLKYEALSQSMQTLQQDIKIKETGIDRLRHKGVTGVINKRNSTVLR